RLAQHAVLLRVERQQLAKVAGAAFAADGRDDGGAIEAALEVEELGAVGLDVGEVFLEDGEGERELPLTTRGVEHVERERLREELRLEVELRRQPLVFLV